MEERRGESRGFRQQPRGTRLVAYHLAPVISDFISDENRVYCNTDLEQTLTLLHSECSKEIEPSGQSSTHHPLVVSNPIDKKGSEFMRTSMRWERQNPRLVAGMGRASGRNENHHDGRSDYMPGPRTRMDNH